MAHAELTPTQFTALLKTVQLGRITQNHLGRLAAMDPATIQGVVQRLVGRGLIRRGRDPMDRRTAVLEPTEAGVALISGAVPCARRAHDAALAPLSPEERVRCSPCCARWADAVMDAVPAADHDRQTLGFGFSFADLAAREGLVRLDRVFLDRLAAEDAALHARLLAARAASGCARHSGRERPGGGARRRISMGSSAALFGIEAETLALARADPRARPDPRLQAAVRAAPGGEEICRSVAASTAPRCAPIWKRGSARRSPSARSPITWRPGRRRAMTAALDVALRYAAWATLTAAGHAAHPGNTLFHVPHRLDYQHLVPVETIERDGVTMLRLPEHHWRPRDGFALTDAGMNAQQALDQINYCICAIPRARIPVARAEGSQDRRIPEVAVRRDAGGLSAG